MPICPDGGSGDIGRFSEASCIRSVFASRAQYSVSSHRMPLLHSTSRCLLYTLLLLPSRSCVTRLLEIRSTKHSCERLSDRNSQSPAEQVRGFSQPEKVEPPIFFWGNFPTFGRPVRTQRWAVLSVLSVVFHPAHSTLAHA